MMAAAPVVSSRRSPSTSYGVGTSVRSDATWLTQHGKHNMGKGNVLYTGPGGVRNYRAHVVTDNKMVGIGTMSQEGTSNLGYLWRGALGHPHPKSRGKWAGEVGWLIPPFVDWKNVTSDHQIQVGEFRKKQEEKYTHRFQEPWYPAPNHADYAQMFRHTNYYRSHTPSPSQRSAAHTRRPHTVASYHPEQSDSFPAISNVRPGSAVNSTTSSTCSINRRTGEGSIAGVHSQRSSSSSTSVGYGSPHPRSEIHPKHDPVDRNKPSGHKRFGLVPSATQTTDFSHVSER